MPTYVYECSKCETTFEVEQRITEDPIKDCSCGATGTVKRLIQPTAVMFKGSGFHINDYKGAPPTAKTDDKASTPEAPQNSEPCGPSCSCAEE
ncbi:MAG: zinc ribbon domain-containing protein [Armatimonadetes bacterium]|nr:zinc ribbon domain-containing protein [Armatimonadota bacterium]